MTQASRIPVCRRRRHRNLGDENVRRNKGTFPLRYASIACHCSPSKDDECLPVRRRGGLHAEQWVYGVGINGIAFQECCRVWFVDRVKFWALFDAQRNSAEVASLRAHQQLRCSAVPALVRGREDIQPRHAVRSPWLRRRSCHIDLAPATFTLSYFLSTGIHAALAC